jgi:hypothetical protein
MNAWNYPDGTMEVAARAPRARHEAHTDLSGGDTRKEWLGTRSQQLRSVRCSQGAAELGYIGHVEYGTARGPLGARHAPTIVRARAIGDSQALPSTSIPNHDPISQKESTRDKRSSAIVLNLPQQTGQQALRLTRCRTSKPTLTGCSLVRAPHWEALPHA